MNTAKTTFLPRLARGLRMQYEPAQSRWVLFLPEGMLQLNDSAAEILRRCDGRHTVAAIVGELEALFDTQGIAHQVQSLLDEGLHHGWID